MVEEPVLTQGVRNTKVIDLIMPSADGEVILRMIEDRPWGSDPEQLSELEEKFNNYIDYILDGWLVKQYPQYLNRRIGIELSCLSSPEGEVLELIGQIERYCQSSGVRFFLTCLQ